MLFTIKYCPSIKCILLQRNEFGDEFYIEVLNNIIHLNHLEALIMKSILFYILIIR